MGEATRIDGKSCLRYSSRDDKKTTYYFMISRYSHLKDDYADRVSEILHLDASVSPARLEEIYHESPRAFGLEKADDGKGEWEKDIAD